MDSTVISTIDHRKEELDGIDAQLSSLRAQIQELLSRRNDLVPIAALPDEVLCRIFETVRLHSASMTRKSSGGVEWARLTHVCRRWRKAGLNEPRLWSEITDTAGLGWLEAHLQRSKSAPITVSLAGRSEAMPERITEQLRKALSETDRLMSLELLCDRVGHIPRWFDALGPSAANLHTIAFRGNSGHDHLRPLCNDWFLKDGAPLLRSLHIQNGKMKWTSPLLAGLHTLVYYRTSATPAHDNPYSEATSAQILTSLATMRNLTQLHLKNMRFPPAEDNTYLNLPTAHLPVMRELRLGGTLDAIAGLLQHLKIPASASVIANCMNPSSDAAAALACAFRTLWDCGSEITMPSTTYSLRVDTTRSRNYSQYCGRIALLPRRVDMSTLPSTSEHPLEGVSLDIASRLLHSSKDIVRVVSGLPFLDYVRCIHVLGPFINLSELSNLLKLTPSLEEAVVEDFSAPPMRHSLPQWSPAHLPLLRRLRIHGAAQSVEDLLQQLRIPLSASVGVTCYGGPNSAAALARAIGPLWGPVVVGPSAKLSSGSATTTRSHSLRMGAVEKRSGSCIIMLLPHHVDLSALPLTNTDAVDDAVLDIDFTLPRRSSPDIAGIVAALPFTKSVRCLDMVGELVNVSEVRRVLALMPSLEEVVLRDLSAAQFVEYLLEENTTAANTRPSNNGPADAFPNNSNFGSQSIKKPAASTLVPELRRVVFAGANLGAYYCPKTDGRPLSMEDVVQAALAHSLSCKSPPPPSRAIAADLGSSAATESLGIRCIGFRECWSIDRAMIAAARDRLLPAGVEIEWDGQMLQRCHSDLTCSAKGCTIHTRAQGKQWS